MPPVTEDPTLAGRLFGDRRQPVGQPPGIEAENRALWTLVEELSTQLSREAARRVRLESLLADAMATGAGSGTAGPVGPPASATRSGASGSALPVAPVTSGSRAEGSGANPVLLDDEESERAESVAFDRFFAAPDPDLDRTRRFLLD